MHSAISKVPKLEKKNQQSIKAELYANAKIFKNVFEFNIYLKSFNHMSVLSYYVYKNLKKIKHSLEMNFQIFGFSVLQLALKRY